MRVVLVGSLCALVLACGDTSGPPPPSAQPPPPRAVAKIELLSGGGQRGEVGMALAEPIVVRATDSLGAPVWGATIRFSPSPSNSGSYPRGSVSVDSVVTDQAGGAQTRWTLGSLADVQYLSVNVRPSPSWVGLAVIARARAGAAASLRMDHDPRSAVTLGDSAWFTVFGVDRFGNLADLPQATATLTWRVLDPSIAQVAAIEEVPIASQDERRHQRVVLLGRAIGSTTLELLASGSAVGAALSRVDVRVYAGPGRDIAFTRRDADGVQRIYLLSADGSRLTLLADGGEPAWSPDGREIAFTIPKPYPVGQTTELMNADGSGRRPLFADSRRSAHPAWSPDGRQLAIIGASSASIYALYVVNRDGSEMRALCRSPHDPYCGGGDRLSWSPDGTVISSAIWLIIHGGGTHRPIVLVNADGSGSRLLSSLPGGSKLWAREPTWSPDGRHLLFHYSGLQVIGSDGTGLRTLLRDGGEWPTWSPDGRIAFGRASPVGEFDRSGGKYGLFVVNADGTELRRVMGGDILHPAWRPSPL